MKGKIYLSCVSIHNIAMKIIVYMPRINLCVGEMGRGDLKMIIIVFCILKLMNSQNKYVKANSLKKHKQNYTGGFIPPDLVTFSLDCSLCIFGPTVHYGAFI